MKHTSSCKYDFKMNIQEYFLDTKKELEMLSSKYNEKNILASKEVREYFLSKPFKYHNSNHYIVFKNISSVSFKTCDITNMFYFLFGEHKFSSCTCWQTNINNYYNLLPISKEECIKQFEFWSINTKEKNKIDYDYVCEDFKKWNNGLYLK